MLLSAVDVVVKDNTLKKLFYINENYWLPMKKSWEEKQPAMQGRFDFSYDGNHPPKMLEFNGDTPSMQIESDILSAQWL